MSVDLVTTLVKCVEQGCVYQSPKSNHAGGTNNELSQKTAKGKFNNLAAECIEEEFVHNPRDVGLERWFPVTGWLVD